MKQTARVSLGLLFCALAAVNTNAGEVADLAWLQGQWQSSDGASWSEEHWLAPRDGLMLGLNRSANAKGRLAFEFLRIQADADGTPVYWASPGGSPAVPFRWQEGDAHSAVFVNPDHDYPGQISYRRDGDTLSATISAVDGSNAMQFDWTLDTAD